MLEFLTKNKTVIMPQPLNSTDLPIADYFLFPKLKKPMKGKRFAIEEIKEKSKWEQYAIARLRSVSKIAKNAGINVLYIKVVIL